MESNIETHEQKKIVIRKQQKLDDRPITTDNPSEEIVGEIAGSSTAMPDPLKKITEREEKIYQGTDEIKENKWLTPISDNIPLELREYNQWVNWKASIRDGKVTKPPCQPNGLLAKTNDPETWSSFSSVEEAMGCFDGIGFVLTGEDNFVGLDFDKCRNPESDLIDPKINEYIRKFDSYTEISPSGKGIRVFVKGKLPVDGRKKGKMEAYQSGRYVTLTGHVLDGFPTTIERRQEELDDFYKEVFSDYSESSKVELSVPEQNEQRRDSFPWRDRLDAAFKSKKGTEIKRLWDGDHSAYSSQSEADLALCSNLAFWLDKDPVAIDAAFRESGLYREKWDEKHSSDGRTYGETTIEKAINSCHSFYGEGVQHNQESWPDPTPFDDYSLLPTFPTEMFPGVCREMTEAVSETCQVDPGLTGSMMLAALSTAVGGKIKIDLTTHKEPGNLYLISVLGSGDRKSETVKQVTKPIYSFQRERQNELSSTIREANNRRKILEKRLEKLQKQAAKTDEIIEREAIIGNINLLLEEINNHPVPHKPVYLCDDITPEALGQLMADNREQMAVLSAEGGFFTMIGGLYHHGEANLDLVLKAHSSDAWSNNRIGREAKTMDSPSLTLGLAVQPNVLEEIGKNSDFRGRGLSARFLYSICQSKAGQRKRHSTPVPDDVERRYSELIFSLMAVDGEHRLDLTPEAQKEWDGLYDKIEELLSPGCELEHIPDWGSKLAGAAARISGLLHLAQHGPAGLEKQINPEAIRAASKICDYYREHARAAFGLMNKDVRITAAKKILDCIKRNNLKKFKGRDIIRQTSFQTVKDMEPGLKILVERGYLIHVSNTGGGIGRPESDTYHVNPKIFK